MAVLDRAVVVGVGSGAVANGLAAEIVALELWRRVGKGGIGACLRSPVPIPVPAPVVPVDDGLELRGQTTFTSSRRCFDRAAGRKNAACVGNSKFD